MYWFSRIRLHLQFRLYEVLRSRRAGYFQGYLTCMTAQQKVKNQEAATCTFCFYKFCKFICHRIGNLKLIDKAIF